MIYTFWKYTIITLNEWQIFLKNIFELLIFERGYLLYYA